MIKGKSDACSTAFTVSAASSLSVVLVELAEELLSDGGDHLAIHWVDFFR